MRIGGFQKISLIDYPGKIAAVVFTQGCNFRCPFCHNLSLVLPSCFSDPIDNKEVMAFLRTRIGKLQGVVVTGGEPTLQPDLADFIQEIKAMGYAVKLDTNGSRPRVLRSLITDHMLDYIAMDVKAPIDRYHEVSGVPVNPGHIQESITMIRKSGLAHEFRTTFPKPLLHKEDLPGILSLIDKDSHFKLQPFVAQDAILDNSLLDQAHYQEEEFNKICEELVET